jgi:hypothetical protein
MIKLKFRLCCAPAASSTVTKPHELLDIVRYDVSAACLVLSLHTLSNYGLRPFDATLLALLSSD